MENMTAYQQIKNGRLNINSPELLQVIINDIKKRKIKTLAIDTETTGLDTLYDKIFYIPIGYNTTDGSRAFLINLLVDDKTKGKMIVLIKELFNYINENKVNVVFHNAAYDLGVLKSNYGVELDTNHIDDTMYKAIHINTAFFKGDLRIDVDSAMSDGVDIDTELDFSHDRRLLPIALKPLSDRLDLKDVNLPQFDEITKLLQNGEWDRFKEAFSNFVSINELSLNKYEEELLSVDSDSEDINKSMEFFLKLFVDPEKHIKTLKDIKESQWNKDFIKFYNINKGDFSGINVSDDDLKAKNFYKTMLKKQWNAYEDDDYLNMMRLFHESYFHVSQEYSAFFAPYSSITTLLKPNISYAELARMSELVLFIYSIADAKLTVQVNIELNKIINKRLRELFAPMALTPEGLRQKAVNFITNYKLDLSTLYGLVEQQFTGMPVDITNLKPQLDNVKKSINVIHENINLELKKIYDFIIIDNDRKPEEDRIDKDSLINVMKKDFNMELTKRIGSEELELLPNIKSSQGQKISTIINKYIPWFKMFINVQIKQSEILKVTTLLKFVERSRLKTTDYELYEAFIKVNLRNVNKDTIKEFDSYFGIDSDNGKKVRMYIENYFLKYSRDIIERLFQKEKQPSSPLTKHLRIFLKETKIDRVLQKTFKHTSGIEYKLGMDKGDYTKLREEWYLNSYLNQEEIKNGMTFKELFEGYVLKPIFKTTSLRLLEAKVSKDIISTSTKDGHMQGLNKLIVSFNIKSKVPKRTINAETIPQFIAFGETIDDSEDYTLEQKDVLHALIDIVKYKKINDTQTKWLLTYGVSIGHKAVMGRGRFMTSLRWNAETGRGTSSAQQFPNGKLYSPLNKNFILFDPRSIFKPTEGKMLVFIDYQNVEVKAANIAIRHFGLVDKAYDDAYVPIGCRNQNGELWDFKNEDHKLNVKKYTWVRDNGEVWEPLDLHGNLAKTVDPTLVEGTPEFTKMRKLCKKITFGKQYGQAIKGMILANPNVEVAKLKSIYDGLNQLHISQEQVITNLRTLANTQGFFEAYHGRIFSFPRNKQGTKVLFTHKLFNYYCQGMGAIFLKRGVRDSYNYSKAHPDIDVKMMNSVHDEIQFVAKLDAKNIRALFEYKRLMNTHTDVDFPITSDIEISPYAWGYKWTVEDDFDGNITVELEHTLDDGRNVNIIRTPEQVEICGNKQVDFNNLKEELGHVIIREKDDNGDLVVVEEFINE